MARRDKNKGIENENETRSTARRTGKKMRGRKRSADERKSAGLFVLRVCVIGILGIFLAATVAGYFFDNALLQLPRKLVSAAITPVEEVFTSITDGIVEYIRRLKYRSVLEEKYTELLSINEELRNENARLSDYENQVNQLYDLLDEKNEFQSMRPLSATVIGHDTGSYFSVLQLNAGSADGVKDYMAVISNGGLVGYTYDTAKNTCSVRCIIDSDATVAGMLQTGRDQGSVTGTYGIDGTAMCRMYYLPENSLPRPGEMVVTSGVGMEFPRGLPVGTVRESTRGLDENKSYIVLEPVVDFQHLEHVIVLLYQPSYAEAAESRGEGAQATLVPLATVRPVPTFQSGIVSGFHTAAPTEEPTATPTPSPTPAPTATPAVGMTDSPDMTPRPTNIVYVAKDPNATPTPTPTPVPTPTPTLAPTFNPKLTLEED